MEYSTSNIAWCWVVYTIFCNTSHTTRRLNERTRNFNRLFSFSFAVPCSLSPHSPILTFRHFCIVSTLHIHCVPCRINVILQNHCRSILSALCPAIGIIYGISPFACSFVLRQFSHWLRIHSGSLFLSHLSLVTSAMLTLCHASVIYTTILSLT